jgi:hypothetical protein
MTPKEETEESRLIVSTTTEEVHSFDSLLVTNESPDGEIDKTKYIKPNIETKLSTKRRQECRDIVLEIKKFGTTQRQMLYLIYLLSLELEDIETIRALTTAIGVNRDRIPVDSLAEENIPKLILPGSES